MNILAALGSFRDKALIQEIQKYILAKVPHRNKFIPIAYMAANPHAIPDLWEWYLDNIEELEQFHPMHYERVITAIVPIGGIGKEEQIQSFFSDYMSKKPKAQDAIKLALEKLKINAGMRAR
jgi:tricorn protease interacting factor F2/3